MNELLRQLLLVDGAGCVRSRMTVGVPDDGVEESWRAPRDAVVYPLAPADLCP